MDWIRREEFREFQWTHWNPIQQQECVCTWCICSSECHVDMYFRELKTACSWACSAQAVIPKCKLHIPAHLCNCLTKTVWFSWILPLKHTGSPTQTNIPESRCLFHRKGNILKCFHPDINERWYVSFIFYIHGQWEFDKCTYKDSQEVFWSNCVSLSTFCVIIHEI